MKIVSRLTGTHSSELNVKTSVLWESTSISVCWENPTSDNEADRNAIRNAIQYWWNYRAGFNFHGWQPCGVNGADVRVIITDEKLDGTNSPHVKDFGRNLKNRPNGVVFPHTYRNHWDTNCQGTSDSHYECQRKYAVHEFGHVLGFIHEQGRDDTPSWCNETDSRQSSYSKMGPWDPQSVMGYCSSPRLGGGQLSGFDIFYSMRAYDNDWWKVYFFEHYQDSRTGYNTGWYSGSGCRNVFSHHNDTYSAIWLGSGVKSVRVYEHVNCGGASKLFYTSGFLGGDWNDKISSFEILY